MSEETITLYQAIGGDDTVRKLTHRFYELMDTLPEAKNCRAIHPPSLEGSERKLYEYLTGYLGGPPIYVEKYGHPRLRSRHFGATLGWSEWEALVARLADFVEPPRIDHRGTEREQAKAMVADPSGNLIELKAYRDPRAVLGELAA